MFTSIEGKKDFMNLATTSLAALQKARNFQLLLGLF
jgi:hypothetical protein